jgi:hypothetical protein
MADEVLFLMTLYKEGKRTGLEVSETIETLTGRAAAYKELVDEVKFWKCEEIEKKEVNNENRINCQEE